jgi:hypothetical protein
MMLFVNASIHWQFAASEVEKRSGLGVESVYILMTSKDIDNELQIIGKY